MVTTTTTIGPEFDFLPDDTEESIMGSSFHQGAIVAAVEGLRICAARQHQPWFIGNQQFLLILRDKTTVPRRIAPDVCVYPRLNLANPTTISVAEHGAPTLIIEVASPGTVLINDINLFDPQAKPGLYERIGVQEYLAFDPTSSLFGVPLWARQRGPQGFEAWQPAADGRYHSSLGIAFQPHGELLRIYDHKGQLVPLSTEFDAMLTAERSLRDAERLEREAQERRIAVLEAELQRLRQQ